MRIAKEIRTSIIDNLIRVGNCFGFNGRACDFANKVMPEEIDFDDIERHYDCYNDWNINRLFFSEMHLLEVSDALFIKFCEEYLNPIYNRKERVEKDDGDWIIVDRTLQCERIINNELGRVDLEVELSISENGLSVHKIKNKVQYPSEDIKNIIFAANAKKPDIVIDNALENSVKIIDVGDALVYSDGIPEDGITWRRLVNWYKQYEANETQKALARKLVSSLDSKPEKLFFKTYIEYILKEDRDLPALIPQVYLYYDPKTKDVRGKNEIFEHQRMDFMLIISSDHRVVIEIDGIQHYSQDKVIQGTTYKCADVNRYAKMVSANRDMTLNGYDVYRFGGKELYVKNGESDKFVKKMICDFFYRLFIKYGIIQGKDSIH